jgi:hypothetical protein
VHEQRLVQLPCQLHLRSEPALLDVWGAEVAVEVQPAFACSRAGTAVSGVEVGAWR